ncbi:nuclear nucleic acid-binding protein C1D-like [Elysia marginata]|uniref:Nuclear nucleic acid-binding protein C1D n=1 Tax=Elysia marginata TaxID=1093978 RepID=A0AAV4F1L5_9GAST|nr:nuclear nucleic acid-binding protein C1D-like [Elysia marginata]
MTQPASTSNEDGIPRELKEKLASFDTHLTELEANLNPLLSMPRAELTDQLTTIDAAKVDLVSAYTINSLFWMYLNCCGVNPKEHAVKQELAMFSKMLGRGVEKSNCHATVSRVSSFQTRIQSYMARVKEIEDKKKAPKLDKSASKRFVRSALWHAAQKKGKGEMSTPSPARSSNSNSEQPKRKRKREHR